MEQIKFRAKVKWNGNHYEAGQWVYGYYAYFDGMHQIYDCEENYVTGVGDLTRYEWVEVDENTLGQLINLKDKNGKEIYADDIVIYSDNYGHYEVSSWSGEYLWGNNRFVIEYNHGAYIARGRFNGESMIFLEGHKLTREGYDREIEVVSNIHDNPEMVDKK